MPTSVWSKKAVVDIHQIYTRLSWVKENQTPAGTTQSELKHYSDLFTANKNGVIPKRILVQGQTGIGKSTFVKKLLVDWVEVNKKTGDEQAAVLKNFELVVAVNLKEVSKCQSLKDVIRLSNVFAKEDKYMTEDLVDYITNNQEKVLLIFDGYDEYRSGLDSEIYEIFSGNSLRNCCVLITSRISKADELRGGEDLHAEITGFSGVDREDFMRRFLSGDEVLSLEHLLYERNVFQLAKVPLLLLFFCILWKKGKFKSFPETQTKLYMDIVQFILNHSHSKQSPPQFAELKSFKDILSDIGEVALQCLLKDDHCFEYSQLSDSVRCDKSVLIGLLQITDDSENDRPTGMVSFIHKSIQEFLAAWYVTYRFLPEGGNLGEIGVTLQECLALENVFKFICGLSKEGGLMVISHLKSVRISDPSLDLSEGISEVDMSLSDVTERQGQSSDLDLSDAILNKEDVNLGTYGNPRFYFNSLVLHLCYEFESRAEFLRACLDCLGSIILLSSASSREDLPFDAKNTNSWSLVLVDENPTLQAVSEHNGEVKVLVTESPKLVKVAEFFKKFLSIRCRRSCSFFSPIFLRNGQIFFYITRLKMCCEDHIRLFNDNVVSSHSVHLSSGQPCLKFLKSLKFLAGKSSIERFSAAIKHCNHLESIEVSNADDSLFDFLEQVPNRDRCSLSIRLLDVTSKEVVEYASFLPRFENLYFGRLSCEIGFSAELSTEIVSMACGSRHPSSVRTLNIVEANLTSAAVETLCQALPELSALQALEIGSLAKCSDDEVTQLLAAIKQKTLEHLTLGEINLTSSVSEALDQSLPDLPALQTLKLRGLAICPAEAVTSLVAAVKHKSLVNLTLSEIFLSSAVAEALGQLGELSALQRLEIKGLAEISVDEVRSFWSKISERPGSKGYSVLSTATNPESYTKFHMCSY